jgi:hypothetical protein
MRKKLYISHFKVDRFFEVPLVFSWQCFNKTDETWVIIIIEGNWPTVALWQKKI